MVNEMKNNKTFERIVHGIFLALGLVTVACVLLITVYLVISGIPAIAEIGLWNFLFGTLFFKRILVLWTARSAPCTELPTV